MTFQRARGDVRAIIKADLLRSPSSLLRLISDIRVPRNTREKFYSQHEDCSTIHCRVVEKEAWK